MKSYTSLQHCFLHLLLILPLINMFITMTTVLLLVIASSITGCC